MLHYGVVEVLVAPLVWHNSGQVHVLSSTSARVGKWSSKNNFLATWLKDRCPHQSNQFWEFWTFEWL
eukprot:6440330-Amphidinium_carterae.1